MKKIAFFLILLIAIAIPQKNTRMQSANWLTLQSDTNIITAPGQLLVVTLNGALNIPVTEASLTLKYDPACFRVTSHHPGSLLTGATAAVQAQPGQFDLHYQVQENNQPHIGEGSLVSIQLEALKLCASDLMVPASSVVLKISDAKGHIISLPGVEYHTLTLHLARGQAPAATAIAASPAVQFPVRIALLNNNYVFLGLLALLPVGGVIVSILLRRRFKRSAKPVPFLEIPVPAPLQESNIPALIHAAGLERPILLSQPRTRLGLHTEIIQRGGRFYLADTGSQSGTFLNGSHVGPGYHFLHDGDQVRLGRETSYRFFKPSKTAGI